MKSAQLFLEERELPSPELQNYFQLYPSYGVKLQCIS